MISETVYPATGSAQQYQYAYDKSGNVTNVQYISGSTTQNKTYTYGNTSWGDLLTNYNGTAITYDAVGNPTKWRNAVAIEWYGRQMSLFAHADGSVTNYSYNADGIRTGKQYLDAGGGELGTVKYTLDGNKIVAEQRGNTMLYYLYDDNGSVMGIGYGDNTYTFAKNIQGDVIGIYSGGTLLAKYEYNAYGQIMSITNASGTDISGNASHIANINPFRYRGYYYDTETGFYYLQSRYYDPVVGRFLNADDVSAFAVEQGSLLQYNPFIYCLNDPISRIDESGMWSWPKWVKKAVAVVATAAVVVAATAITVASCGAGTVAGVAMISTAATLTARTTEVVALQVKKGKQEGKSTGQIIKDSFEAVYDNGDKVIGMTPYTKTASIGVRYWLDKMIENDFGMKHTLRQTLKDSCGKTTSAIFVAIAWYKTIDSAFSDDPIARADERGYKLK